MYDETELSKIRLMFLDNFCAFKKLKLALAIDTNLQQEQAKITYTS